MRIWGEACKEIEYRGHEVLKSGLAWIIDDAKGKVCSRLARVSFPIASRIERRHHSF